VTCYGSISDSIINYRPRQRHQPVKLVPLLVAFQQQSIHHACLTISCHSHSAEWWSIDCLHLALDSINIQGLDQRKRAYTRCQRQTQMPVSCLLCKYINDLPISTERCTPQFFGDPNWSHRDWWAQQSEGERASVPNAHRITNHLTKRSFAWAIQGMTMLTAKGLDFPTSLNHQKVEATWQRRKNDELSLNLFCLSK